MYPPRWFLKQGLISSNLKCCIIRGRAPEFGVKVEENISAHSLAKLKELVLSQRSYERISLLFFFFFFVGDGELGGICQIDLK